MRVLFKLTLAAREWLHSPLGRLAFPSGVVDWSRGATVRVVGRVAGQTGQTRPAVARGLLRDDPAGSAGAAPSPPLLRLPLLLFASLTQPRDSSTEFDDIDNRAAGSPVDIGIAPDDSPPPALIIAPCSRCLLAA